MFNKYKNIKVSFDGKKFDSILERDTYIRLKIYQEKRQDFQLIFKKTFDLKACRFIPDFTLIFDNGNTIVMDSKGVLTDSAKLKIKFLKYFYELPVKLIKKAEEVDVFFAGI